ncbi:hypothetical protein ZIOFF_065637 [Zingiber officinale]|uniref:Uncharacterized protein n=1 Tax=Zingiber officinale TaxID=94328 RepID=A0A8J5F0D5_ZINOF|nr:hypothetical protein ZIOFF_065637 [Zingiber officinale]
MDKGPLFQSCVVKGNPDALITDFIVEQCWDLNKVTVVLPGLVADEVAKVVIQKGDLVNMIWKLSSDGKLSMKSAWNDVRTKDQQEDIGVVIWSKLLVAKISNFGWRVGDWVHIGHMVDMDHSGQVIMAKHGTIGIGFNVRDELVAIRKGLELYDSGSFLCFTDRFGGIKLRKAVILSVGGCLWVFLWQSSFGFLVFGFHGCCLLRICSCIYEDIMFDTHVVFLFCKADVPFRLGFLLEFWILFVEIKNGIVAKEEKLCGNGACIMEFDLGFVDFSGGVFVLWQWAVYGIFVCYFFDFAFMEAAEDRSHNFRVDA